MLPLCLLEQIDHPKRLSGGQQRGLEMAPAPIPDANQHLPRVNAKISATDITSTSDTMKLLVCRSALKPLANRLHRHARQTLWLVIREETPDRIPKNRDSQNND